MRPILWGILWFFVGAVGSLLLSGTAYMERMTVGEVFILTLAFLQVFSFIFYFSIPVALIVEVVRWIRGRKNKK